MEEEKGFGRQLHFIHIFSHLFSGIYISLFLDVRGVVELLTGVTTIPLLTVQNILCRAFFPLFGKIAHGFGFGNFIGIFKKLGK